MADTFSQCYFHLVFAVKKREALIKKEWKDELEKYICGIIRNHKHKVYAIGTMPDHIHILISYNLNHLIPDLINDIKTSTNKWIKENKLTKHHFAWQNGYGAFTHSHAQIDQVVKYVLNQEEHHKEKSFRKEYLELLHRNEIQYAEEHLFEFFHDINHWQ